MFRFLELELHGWDYWQPLRIPLDAGVVVLSGPNGSGKTLESGFRRSISKKPGERIARGQRGNVDDRAAALLLE